ncbi:MAG: hypothetical protein H6812_12735 [Phycisphaeraceae bacterium]|nr:hypothetical protein [Phycisphaerales bacterium]MCB9844102.1 hypothetical protein [Phycisphaeraceae bacterium]
MHRARATCQGVHLAAVALWLGATIMTGVAAAIAFPTMRDLDPALPAFADYPTDHWMIAAGIVMNKVFAILDYASVALAIIALQALVIAAMPCRLRLSAPSSIVRLLALAGALASLAYSLFFLRPQMNAHLREFHDHALAGRIAQADAARAAFDALHPAASNALSLIAVALLILIIAGIWSLATDPASPLRGEDVNEVDR